MGKDVSAITELAGDNVDDGLGVAWLYFCALRNVETSSRSNRELKSARPKITARTIGISDHVKNPLLAVLSDIFVVM